MTGQSGVNTKLSYRDKAVTGKERLPTFARGSAWIEGLARVSPAPLLLELQYPLAPCLCRTPWQDGAQYLSLV